MARILSNLEEIRQSIKRYHKFSVTCGVGTIYSDITNVRVSYDNAVTAVDYRLILGRNRIICIEDLFIPVIIYHREHIVTLWI
jgi:two-component system response regulator YesN